MKRVPLYATALLLIALAVGCGGKKDTADTSKKDTTPKASGETFEAIIKDTLKTMDEMTVVFEGIKDKATAEKAKPKIKELLEKAKAQKEAFQKLGKPSEAQVKELANLMQDAQKADKKLEEAKDKAMKNKDVEAVLKDLEKEFKDLDK